MDSTFMPSTRRVFFATAAASGGFLPLAAAESPARAAGPSLDSERFRAAVETGDIPVITQMLDRDPALMYARNSHGTSVYILACLARRKNVADLLVSRGLTLDIFEAAAGGNAARAKELVSAVPESVNLHLPDGRTPLHLATEAGQAEMVIYLNGAGADLSAGRPETPLLAAVDCPDPEAARSMAQFLLINGSDPAAQRKDGTTSLHLAAQRGYVETARLLIHRGADPGARDGQGRLPLQVATGEATALLRNESSVERVYFGRRYAGDLQGKPVQRDDTAGLPQQLINQFVTVAHFNPDKVKQLHKLCPGLLNTRSTWDELAVEAAAHMGLVPLARYLAEAGSPVSTCTAALLGLTPMVRAGIREDPRCLHERGAHDLPLLAYTAYGEPRVEIAELLLAAGVDVSVRAFGQTALHISATKGHLDLAQLLLDHGADINATVPSKTGDLTALALATRAKQDKMAEFLRSRGGRS